MGDDIQRSASGTPHSNEWHVFDPGYSGMSTSCNALVLRDGYGADCGEPREAKVHELHVSGRTLDARLFTERTRRLRDLIFDDEPLALEMHPEAWADLEMDPYCYQRHLIGLTGNDMVPTFRGIPVRQRHDLGHLDIRVQWESHEDHTEDCESVGFSGQGRCIQPWMIEAYEGDRPMRLCATHSQGTTFTRYQEV